MYISKHISFEKIRQHYSSGSKGEIDSYLNFALSNLASLPSRLARFDLESWVTCGSERKPVLIFRLQWLPSNRMRLSGFLSSRPTELDRQERDSRQGEAEQSAPLPAGSLACCACSAAMNLHPGDLRPVPAPKLTS